MANQPKPTRTAPAPAETVDERPAAEILADTSLKLTYGEILDLEKRAAAEAAMAKTAKG